MKEIKPFFYRIHLRGKDGDPYYFHDSLLPGFLPEHVIKLMDIIFVSQELDLCKECPMDCHCHVLVPVKPHNENSPLNKLCTVLFHDAVKPSWKLEDVV